MNQPEKCNICGSPLPAGPEGSTADCPRCLLGLGQIQVAQTMDHQPGSSPAASQVASGQKGDMVPGIDQLKGKFPDLEILSLIGNGGMGAVYKARQISLDRIVALKILFPRLSADPSFVERFTREAQTLAKLDHPNIVTVYNYGQADSMLYLVMEYVDGVNLRQAIATKTIDNEQSLSIIPKICEALQFAHDEGVVHRDIKPENILLDRRGRVKIADFGLAKITGSDVEIPSLTGTRQILGTINYMAPEQIEGDKVDHRADIYSLGVVFYELLTGELPIGRFAAPSEKTEVGVPLDDVVLKALEKEPGRRYQNASEIKTAVEDYSSSDLPSGIPKDDSNKVELVQEAANTVPATDSSNNPSNASSAHSLQSDSQPGNEDSKSKDSNVSWSLPFSISGLHHGMASATGLLNVTAFALDIEFQIKDEVMGVVKSKVTTVRVPWMSIEEITYKQGMFYDNVIIEANRLNALADLPNNDGGRVKLSIKKSNRMRGEQVIAQAQVFCHTAPGPGPIPAPTAPNYAASQMPTGDKFAPIEKTQLGTPAMAMPHSYAPDNQAGRISDKEMERTQAKLKSAAGLILAAAILNFVLMSSSIRGKIHEILTKLLMIPEKLGFEFVNVLTEIDVTGNPFSNEFMRPDFDASIFVSIFFFIVYGNATKAKGFWWAVACCFVALLPIYHSYLIGAAGAISFFLVICRPHVMDAFRQNDDDLPPETNPAFNQHPQRPSHNSSVTAKVVIGIAILIALGIFTVKVSKFNFSPRKNQNEAVVEKKPSSAKGSGKKDKTDSAEGKSETKPTIKDKKEEDQKDENNITERMMLYHQLHWTWAFKI